MIIKEAVSLGHQYVCVCFLFLGLWFCFFFCLFCFSWGEKHSGYELSITGGDRKKERRLLPCRCLEGMMPQSRRQRKREREEEEEEKRGRTVEVE